MFKKLLLSFLAAIVLLVSVFTPYAHAQASSVWYNQTFQEWYSKVYDPDVSPPGQIFGERYTAAQVQWIIYSVAAFFLGLMGDQNIILCFMNKDLNACGRLKDSLASNTSSGPHYAQKQNKSLLSLIFAERSFSGIGYIKEKARKLHIIPEARAQAGYGFKALRPIQQIWKGARDISYILFVFMTLILAFTIMFRVKLFSPQTVITVQSAIPRLVIALILVTFSYAIAGFMVDLMYVVIGFIGILFKAADVALSPITAYQFMTGTLQVGIFCPSSLCIKGLGGVIEYLILFGFVFQIAVIASIFAIMGTSLTNFLVGFILLIVAIIALIILLIVYIITFFRILWMLYKTAAKVYLLVIIAPLQITLGAATNMGGFGGWLKNLASNLAVFPATGAFFYFAFVFLAYAIWGATANIISNIPIIGDVALDIFDQIIKFFNNITNINIPEPHQLTEGWAPPLIGFGGAGLPLIFSLISITILLMIPKLPDIIKSIMTGQPFAFGTAIGEAFKIPRIAGGAGAQYVSTAQQEQYEVYQRERQQAAARGLPLPPIPRKVQMGQRIGDVARKISGGRIK
jgi:hypothetical protein